MAGAPVQGSLLTPDPAHETIALERAKASQEAVEAAAHGGHDGDARREQRSEQREAVGGQRELAGRPEAGRPKDVTD